MLLFVPRLLVARLLVDYAFNFLAYLHIAFSFRPLRSFLLLLLKYTKRMKYAYPSKPSRGATRGLSEEVFWRHVFP
ncbi:hypothetical protein EV1_023126 [Malus domestica]